MSSHPKRQPAAQHHQHQHRSTTGVDRSEPEVVRIGLLGGFRVWVGPRHIEEDRWRLRKARSLIKLLALSAGHRLHREQVMETLWPEFGKHNASNNLYQILHAARRALDPSALASSAASRYLLLKDEQLVLCPDSQLWVDAEAFEGAAATARHAPEPAAFRAAIELYAGELLPQDRYEPWVEERRAELRGLYISLLSEVAALYEERREFGEAIEALMRAVAQEPTHEEAHAELMRLHALSGRRREALSQYERLREALSKEFGTEPVTATTRLQQAIWAGTFPPPDMPVTASIPAGEVEEAPSAAVGAGGVGGVRRNNLPLARTSFVGRERETLEVKRLLAMTRLLTLTGAGGSGKTRLALKVARDLVGAYPEGAWLVDLAPLSEGELVPQAVAQALGVREQPGRPLVQTLKDTLRSRKMLLVVDNCEHLVEAVVGLVDSLLDSCPGLRILATSRETLNAAGEVTWVVPSLTLPYSRQEAYTTQELEGYESVRLFVERAHQRNPSFELTLLNGQAVAQVCRQLEGIPLAIELAAGRMGVLSAEQLALRLEDSLKLLSGGRTADPRHRTLRATLEWSHELLGESERTLFRRLSVFAGGWTLEAAEEMCLGEGLEQDDVLDILSKLVDKSLVLAEASPGVEGELRYRMLEPIRKYGQERIQESGEADATRYRHAASFLALAEKGGPELRGSQQGIWLERLEADHDNMRAALSWALERVEAELALRLGGTLGWFWHMRGHSGEGRRWLQEALAMDDRGSHSARAMALAATGMLALDTGDIAQVEEPCKEGLELLVNEESERDQTKPWLLVWLGYAAILREDHSRAEELSEQSLALGQEMRDRWWVAISLLNLAHVSRIRGDSRRATELFEESIDLFREQGDKNLLAWCLIKLGLMVCSTGDLGRARKLTEEAVALLRELGSVAQAAIGLNNLGWIVLLQGDLGGAMDVYRESLALGWDTGMSGLIQGDLEGFACVAEASGDWERAAQMWGAAQAFHEETGIPRDIDWLAEADARIAAVRSGLGEQAWEEAWAEGEAMGLEEAVEYALSKEEEHEPPTLVAVHEPQQPAVNERAGRLTARQQEVALLVARGISNRQIALELSISEHTVANHVGKILKKWGLRSRTQISS